MYYCLCLSLREERGFVTKTAAYVKKKKIDMLHKVRPKLKEWLKPKLKNSCKEYYKLLQLN